MKFEVALDNPALMETQETMRRLASECPDVEILQCDE
jgi:hypothetical protein